MAWPRLAEYFARFKLSLGMTCNLEVRAPTLSRIPLFVEPTILTINSNPPTNKKPQKSAGVGQNPTKGTKTLYRRCNNHDDTDGDEDDIFNEKWLDIHQDEKEKPKPNNESVDTLDETTSKPEPVCEGRRAIWKATQQFLGHSVEFRNVAHTVVPIRAKSTKGRGRSSPQLEVDVIVHGPRDDNEGLSRDGEEAGEHIGEDFQPTKSSDEQNKAASMVLIRLVNKIPLLDSSEAVACGLVQGLSSKKRMWSSFGLNVNLAVEPSNANKLLMFAVTDSEQVAPFFKSGAHNLLAQEDESDADSEKDVDDNDSVCVPADTGPKRKRRLYRHRNLLPASVRLGNILVIAQIHAEPTTLPLPTLSKVRTPFFCDDALFAQTSPNVGYL